MPRRQPRRPSIGLDSASASARALTAAGSIPICFARMPRAFSSCGRNSWSGGSSRRTVIGLPASAAKIPSKSCCCMGRSLARAVARLSWSSARIIWRTQGMRSSAKNMCSVRQRPIPSAPSAAATRASRGVSALARMRSRRSPSAHSRSLRKPRGGGRGLGAVEQHAQHLGRAGGQGAGDHLAGRAVDRQLVPLAEGLVPHPHDPCLLVDVEVAGADDAGLAEAAGDDGGVRGHAAARGQDAGRGVHADDVLGRGLGAHQQHRSGGRHLGRLLGGQRDPPGGGARAGGQAVGEQRAAGDRLLLRLGVELRGQELRELRGLDAAERLAAVDQPLLHHLDGGAHGGRAGALARPRLQHEQLAVLDGELDVLHVAVVALQLLADLVGAGGWPRGSPRRGRRWPSSPTIGFGVRMPATTSSPWALIRYSP